MALVAEIVPEFNSVPMLPSIRKLELSPTEITPELVKVPIVPPSAFLMPLSLAADIVPELIKDVISPPFLIP